MKYAQARNFIYIAKILSCHFILLKHIQFFPRVKVKNLITLCFNTLLFIALLVILLKIWHTYNLLSFINIWITFQIRHFLFKNIDLVSISLLYIFPRVLQNYFSDMLAEFFF